MFPELGEEGMKVTGNEEQGQRLLVAAGARGSDLSLRQGMNKGVKHQGDGGDGERGQGQRLLVASSAGGSNGSVGQGMNEGVKHGGDEGDGERGAGAAAGGCERRGQQRKCGARYEQGSCAIPRGAWILNCS